MAHLPPSKAPKSNLFVFNFTFNVMLMTHLSLAFINTTKSIHEIAIGAYFALLNKFENKRHECWHWAQMICVGTQNPDKDFFARFSSCQILKITFFYTLFASNLSITLIIIGFLSFFCSNFTLEIGHTLRIQRNGKINANKNWSNYNAGQTDPETIDSTRNDDNIGSQTGSIICFSYNAIQSR